MPPSLYDSIRTQFNRFVDDRICIGVTGLSKSGKSTFITSFINQLLQHDATNAQLGEFSPWQNSYIHSVDLLPLEDRNLPTFDYGAAINGLSGDNPQWPESTTDISGILLRINLQKNKSKNPSSVYVEIRDYPGEWLVDLPMRNMDFVQWSAFILEQFSRSPRTNIEGNPLKALSTLDPLAPFDSSHLDNALEQYMRFLKTCKQHNPPLSLLQPGRFLQPGQYAGFPMMMFVPLINCAGIPSEVLKKADKHSLFKVLEQRYEEYKQVCIEDFFKEFIAPVNRQVVLVDALTVLNGGAEYLDDMIEALDRITSSFNYGSRWYSSGIERVHFIASKVDHVLNEHHDSTQRLLENIIKETTKRIRKRHRDNYQIEAETSAVASIRSSQDEPLPNSHERCVVAWGSEGKKVKYTPPAIPDHIPSTEEWKAFIGWHWPQLNPPKGTRVSQDQAIQHIRMDRVIKSLIGDLCK